MDNRLSVDGLSQKEYASILQRNIDNESYMVRGHFAYDDQFGNDHSISLSLVPSSVEVNQTVCIANDMAMMQ